MARGTKHWLITDTHFNHDAIIKACNRPDNADQLMVSNMVKLCAAQDWLIHIGDVIFYQYPKLKEIMDRIPCRKVLVMGNHDKKPKNWYMRNGFDFAADSFTWGNVLFSHRPTFVFPDGVDYNIHGHWYNNDVENNPPEGWSPKTHYKLAVEDTNYCPVSLDKVKATMDQRNGK